jgi:hypothetical protein
VILVRNRQLLTTLSAARSQNAATILGSHSLTEAVLVDATAIVRLKCSFHCFLLIYLLLFSLIWAAKVLISFELRKKYAKFSASFYVFFQKSSTFAPENDIKSIF